ncbi:MAG: aldose 1-epimerase family protein [Beijerinckiaceae bacterium]
MTAIALQTGKASAEIALEGAQARIWTIGGTPLLWRPNPVFWPDTAPILFPVVGWTAGGRVRVGATCYPLGLHGFARHADFAVGLQAPGSVRLDFASNAATRKLYPFDFFFSVEHGLSEMRFATVLTIANRGVTPMPYACGLHPGFCWPFAGGSLTDYRLRFEHAEEPFVPEISTAGLFLPTRRRLPLDGPILPLTPDLFANEALCFLAAKSRFVRFEHESGAAITIEAESFPHFAVWSRPGASFLSIETWTGYGDPENFEGDLFEKPSMLILPPGEQARHAANYIYTPAK